MSDGTEQDMESLTEAEKNAIHDATGDYDTLFAAVERILAERIAQGRREGAAALAAVHARYFDMDGKPGRDDTEPEPEDVWRYDRDFRAALRG